MIRGLPSGPGPAGPGLYDCQPPDLEVGVDELELIAQAAGGVMRCDIVRVDDAVYLDAAAMTAWIAHPDFHVVR
jgi:hypothetical protein